MRLCRQVQERTIDNVHNDIRARTLHDAAARACDCCCGAPDSCQRHSLKTIGPHGFAATFGIAGAAARHAATHTLGRG